MAEKGKESMTDAKVPATEAKEVASDAEPPKLPPASPAIDSGIDAGPSGPSHVYDQDNWGNNLLQASTESDDNSTDEGYTSTSNLLHIRALTVATDTPTQTRRRSSPPSCLK
jgi:hypothetical protein